ncbi:WAT1-related protein [Dioscorea alata]|uniref:WAT1-related protein n=2 Tax=Dioscorea alata TaxID=55571 RepID=A0ACB7US79_DIOAL|nr:WAT1-related protein [Dioscorea alata]
MGDKRPYMAMVVVQVIFAGMALTSKAAFNHGMNTFIFLFYRQAFSVLLLLPLSLLFGRKNATSLPFKLLLKIFFWSLIGLTVNLNVYNVAIKFTSTTVATAATNAIPVLTFILAVLLKMETLNPKRMPGILKSLGIAFCLAGVLVIAFYKGPQVISMNSNHPTMHGSVANHHVISNSMRTWIKGTFLMVLATIAWSSWIVSQGFLLNEYPHQLIFQTLCAIFSTFQSFLVAIAFERHLSKWKLHLDVGLYAIAYGGIFVGAIGFYLQTWSIDKKGPVFAAIFTPLSLVITTALSAFLLNEITYFGSVLGAVLMVIGLYCVLWGKIKEKKPRDEILRT